MSTVFKDSVFKYFSFSGLARFSQSWALRLTPPREFNDPFEFYPSVNNFFNKNDIVPEFKRLAPAMFVRDLTAKMLPQFRGLLTEQEVDTLNSLLFIDGSEHFIASQLDYFARKLPNFPISKFLTIRKEILSNWPKWMAQADIAADRMLPKVNRDLQDAFINDLASKFGVVCLSHSESQPLMWAHYADSHQGALVVFDVNSKSFARNTTKKGRIGYLNNVSYSPSRPTLNYQTLTDIDLFEAYTLTKSEDWNYETECRLVLALTEADSILTSEQSKIHLLSIEPSAIRSIVFGCNVNRISRDEFIRSTKEDKRASHLSFYQSSMDQTKYKLNYTEIAI